MNKQWQAAAAVIQKIEQAGFEAVFVGGAVRDHLLNRPSNDVDVATSALPEEVKRIFHKTVDVGIEHGTILVLDTGEPTEVTTYRTEGDYIDFRRPEQVQFVRNLEEDLKRRDFTMNALAMRHTGEIIDLYGGTSDLQRGVIRAVGDARERFNEDALRMLRAARFSAQLGFTIEEDSFVAIQSEAHLLQHIAVERIAIELEKMWQSERPALGMQMLVDSGLSEHLAGDFTDVSKRWQSFKASDSKDGWAYFVVTTNDDTLIKSYKLSNKEKNYILAIQRALRLLQKRDIAVIDLFYVEEAHLQTAHCFATWLGIAVLDVATLLSRKATFSLQTASELQVNGKDLMAWTKQRGGPWVKYALDKILLAVLNGEVENDTEHIKDWFLRDDNDER